MSNNMLLFFLFLSINALWFSGTQSKSHGFFNYSNKGIVGGKNTTIEQHPYQVAVFVGNDARYFCGGSIISPRYILTAAHCINNVISVIVAHVRVGSTYVNRGGTVYTSKKTFCHPLYNLITDYDVGLIDLGKNIKLDGKTSKAISLPPPGAVVQPGTNVVVTGWGRTKEDGNTSVQLMEVTVPTVSNADCSQYYAKTPYRITQRMLCAGLPQGGKSTCQDDSGGPAVDISTGVQLGVASWEYGCARPGFPGVYANLSNIEIRSWIKNVTGI